MQDQNTLDFTSLIKELGVDKLPRKEQEKVLGDILDAINMRVLTKASSTLSQEQHEQVKADIAKHPEQTQHIILSLIPEEQQARMFQEEIEAVKKELKQES